MRFIQCILILNFTNLIMLTKVKRDYTEYQLTPVLNGRTQVIENIDTADTNNDQENYVLLKIPVSSLNKARHKRFLGSLLAGISAFVVKSGVWTAFKVSCTEFLKFTGGAIIGEIYDKYFSSKDSRRRRDINNMTIPIPIEQDEFLDGCQTTFQCFNSEANTTQYRILNQIKSIPRTSCDAGGLIHINSMEEKISVPEKYYHHAFRDRCFPEETMCVVLLRVRLMHTKGSLIGCGDCPLLQMEFEIAYFNVTNLNEAGFCAYVQNPVLRTPQLVPGGVRQIYLYELERLLEREIKPKPVIAVKTIMKNVGLDFNINKQNVNYMLHNIN